MRRLDNLALGLLREALRLKEDDLLLYVERRDYREAMHQTMRGLEDARVALAGVLRRLEKNG